MANTFVRFPVCEKSRTPSYCSRIRSLSKGRYEIALIHPYDRTYFKKEMDSKGKEKKVPTTLKFAHVEEFSGTMEEAVQRAKVLRKKLGNERPIKYQETTTMARLGTGKRAA